MTDIEIVVDTPQVEIVAETGDITVIGIVDVGPPGVQGPQGIQGIAGADGTPGGPQGDPGTPGSQGNCQLRYVNATQIKLYPVGGNILTINGVGCAVPSTGITKDNSGLSASTSYYVYATASGTNVNALELSTTAHATSSATGNIGVEIKSGDATRTLVGMIRTNASSQFSETVTKRFLRSWFNRVPKALYNTFTASRTTTSVGTFVELNSEIRVEFLIWPDEVADLGVNGSSWNSTTLYAVSAIGVDGIVVGGHTANNGTTPGPIGVTAKVGDLSEGYHYATVMGCVNSASTGTWSYIASILFTELVGTIG